MLNPVETFWSKMKAVLKQRMRVPQVQPPRVGEQRLAYVQGLIVESMGLITAQDIVNSCQHAQGFFQCPLNLEDMKVGAWICILDTCIIIFLVQYSWFRLFCYGYFVFGYLFAFCCLQNWYVIKWEVLKLICTILKCSWNYLKLTWIIWNLFGNFWNWHELSEIHLEMSEIDLKKV